ncbi:phage tail tube protein [Paenibacillus doosanensis]|uniref:Phage-like element PBSX protein XkdM n=1 Tax=Paenibacillus konkukensis TaxID=2020716 RepID=A0ABY4RPR5_9BACL|nr:MULTISPECIES: phage tail tube protein [Paenibacillus]MCS7463384.1 phage tail tube protein [Paenibacillus doosanensis]UQZ84017.1 Phage-like element PBSX protein XkdM [Paenibacillus konkukensis]
MGMLDATRTIQGSFGEIWCDGEWLSNFYSGEATADISYEKIKRAGTRKTGNKAGTIELSGTIKGYKVTSELARNVARVMNDGVGALVTQLTMKLADPEAYGYERILLKGVQFTKIDIMKFEHGSIVETEWPFVFDDFEWLNAIPKSR